jgi:hypothetical protein
VYFLDRLFDRVQLPSWLFLKALRKLLLGYATPAEVKGVGESSFPESWGVLSGDDAFIIIPILEN